MPSNAPRHRSAGVVAAVTPKNCACAVAAKPVERSPLKNGSTNGARPGPEESTAAMSSGATGWMVSSSHVTARLTSLSARCDHGAGCENYVQNYRSLRLHGADQAGGE